MNIPADRMTPKERMTAFATGKPMDRIPCTPLLGQNTSLFFGFNTAQYTNSPEVMFKTMVRAFELFRPDGISISPSLQTLPEALGAKLKFVEASAPIVVEPGIHSYEELEDKAPADPHKDGRLPYYLEALKNLNERVGGEVFVSSGIGGPFTAASLLCGSERFLRDLIKNPESAKKALRLCTKSICNYMDAVTGELGLSVSISEPLASTTLLSVKRFKEFVAPYLAEIVNYSVEKYGKRPGTHICGTTKGIWEDVADCGLSAFSLDNVERIAEAVEVIGGRMVISGNVPPVDALLLGTTADVLEASRRCIEEGRNSPRGFVLSSGCEIPAKVPAENIQAMMDAVRIYGTNASFH